MQRRTLTTLVALAALTLSGTVIAAGSHAEDHDHGDVKPAIDKPGQAAKVDQTITVEMSEGLVKKMDPETGKLTIKHGEIKHLDMPPMTMVFTVKDKSKLSNINAGDKIRFMVMDEGGKLIITEIQPAE